jgi:hypothetical protein
MWSLYFSYVRLTFRSWVTAKSFECQIFRGGPAISYLPAIWCTTGYQDWISFRFPFHIPHFQKLMSEWRRIDSHFWVIFKNKIKNNSWNCENFTHNNLGNGLWNKQQNPMHFQFRMKNSQCWLESDTPICRTTMAVGETAESWKVVKLLREDNGVRFKGNWGMKEIEKWKRIQSVLFGGKGQNDFKRNCRICLWLLRTENDTLEKSSERRS